MNKKLKLETIVSKDLYINRKADQQLKQIVDDMSRPASILVSRQMGKTNLLLNIKNKYENKDMIFVYIDLSKTDNDMRDCFRYIIDTAIDTNLEIFESIEDDIAKIRAKNRLPYREHEQELLTLLKCCSGKIIIILDEIDSMTSFSFSDQFFSQIRSVYYSSRTNYKEFNNLTYLLSGVLEPSDIIKDKNKSPFNISEKVYLNDFTMEEFNKFIENIDFDFFNKDITNKIFEWTNGHPRMIWNICSMLEEIYLEKGSLIVDDVNHVVELLYLNKSDLAPIDHIKILLNDNHDMVQVVLELKQNIALNITDHIKNKLYLYGIIDIKDGQNKIIIKNKIIDTVLSEDYLQGILYTSKTPFDSAYSLFNTHNYSLALTEFHKCLGMNNSSKEEKNYLYYYAGLCLVKLGEYRIALDTFEETSFNIETEARSYYQMVFDTGICHYWLKEFDKALEKYNTSLLFKDPKIQINAFINIASVHLQTDKDKDKIEKNLNEAIEILEKNVNDLDKEYYKETLSKAYFNKAAFYVSAEFYQKAIPLYNSILQIEGIEEFKPNVLQELIAIDSCNTQGYLVKTFEIISKYNLKLEKINDSITFSESTLYRYIYNLIENDQDSLLKIVLNYCQNTYEEFKSKCNILLLAAEYYVKNIVKKEKILLYCLKYEKDELTFNRCYKDVYSELIYLYYQRGNYILLKSYADKVIDLYIEVQNQYQLSNNEYNIVNVIFEELILQNDFVFAQKLFEKIEQHILPNISRENIIYKALFLDKKCDLSFNLFDKNNISKECFLIIDDYKNQLIDLHPSLISYSQRIKKKHYQYLLNSKQDVELNKKLQVKRNEMCPCGSNNKYKNCCIK